METPEQIHIINKRLLESFGKFEDGRANWRVVWSDNEFEKRLVEVTDEGFQLLEPYVKEVPKYSYARHRYILERLVPVPLYSELTTKTSYEPIWTFQDNNGNYLPPIWEAIYLLVNTVQNNLAMAGRNAPYKLPEGEGNTKEEIEQRINKLQEQLFGNESALTDSLRLDSAVGYGSRQRNDWVK